MSVPRRWDRHSRRAAAAALGGLLLCIASAAGALRLGPPPAPAGAVGPDAPVAPRDSAAEPADSTVRAAVASAPFRADRTPPEARYRPPSEQRTGGGRTDPALDRLRLVGTATRGDGGLAAFELDGREVRVAEPGEDVEGLRLLRVAPGGATLRGDDTTVVLRVERPGAGGEDP